MPRSERLVWFVAFPGSDALDIVGPWEVFAHANEEAGGAAYALKLMSPSPGMLRTRHGLILGEAGKLPTRMRRQPDITLIAGGSPQRPLPPCEASLLPWLRRHGPRLKALASVCTGAFVLGEAGLLDGRKATTHWRFVGELSERFPRAYVQDSSLYTQDGSIWTSAGITAGIDMALAMVERHQGRAVAMAVARRLVLFLRRSGHQTQFSPVLERQGAESARLKNVSMCIAEHLHERLPVTTLAALLGMSVRSLSRWCREELGESPAEMIRRQRIDEARRLLEQTDEPLKSIAQQAGLGDSSTLWRAFTQRLGVTPAQYRQRFSTDSHP